jgi:hypothetical protein
VAENLMDKETAAIQHQEGKGFLLTTVCPYIWGHEYGKENTCKKGLQIL